MRLKPTYTWTFSKEPVDALVTKQEREARKDIVVRGKTGKRYRVEKAPRPSGRSVMASVQGMQHNGSSNAPKRKRLNCCIWRLISWGCSMTYYISRKEAKRIAFANPKLTLKQVFELCLQGV